jgi:DNA-binding NtrC family response regulator
MRTMLIFDPKAQFTASLGESLGTNDQFLYVETFGEAQRALRSAQCQVGLVIFDSESESILKEVESLINSSSVTEWIAVVRPDSLGSTHFQSLLLASFYDYHTLPLDVPRLAVTVGHAYGKASLRQSVIDHQSSASSRFGICGESPVMQSFFQQLERVIDAELTVLLGGETGTGKELVAQAIHKFSKRSQEPFVAVNCAAIPANLIQAELFGYEKGAFSGATQRKIGSIEAANNGVLFLDEVGDFPIELQANLLRALQERAIIRVGSVTPIPVDFRVIAATHIDLLEAVKAGKFREDLYYRLNVLHLSLPPLRERGSDIQLLAETILSDLAGANRHCRASGFTRDAIEALNNYPWPGNVRELKNRIHRAIILSERRLISAQDLGFERDAEAIAPGGVTLEDARTRLDRQVLESCLRANANNVSKTARQLGISRVTLYRMLNKHSIETSH